MDANATEDSTAVDGEDVVTVRYHAWLGWRSVRLNETESHIWRLMCDPKGWASSLDVDSELKHFSGLAIYSVRCYSLFRISEPMTYEFRHKTKRLFWSRAQELVGEMLVMSTDKRRRNFERSYNSLREAAKLVLSPVDPIEDEEKIGAAPIDGLQRLREALSR